MYLEESKKIDNYIQKQDSLFPLNIFAKVEMVS